jgi:DNA primase
MISKNIIDKIFSVLKIEEVISDFILLKKCGNNYKGFSPFSKENTPSFIVSPSKKIWKDFSSGRGGNCISFLMQYKNYTYPESLKYLANKYNIKINDNKKIFFKKNIENFFIINEYAKNFFIKQLFKTKNGKTFGFNYLLKEKKLKINIIKKFELGYVSSKLDSFTNYALKKGFNINTLNQVGLTILKEKKKFDRFRARIIFPIHSISGKILGFGARKITNFSYENVKYLNSPESNIYHKSEILYGIYKAKKYILKKNYCYLTEGYFDMISLYQSGIKNVVSSLGTSLTIIQILLIKRFTNNIIFIYDGDEAGIKAINRNLNLLLEQNINIKIVLLPYKQDPYSFFNGKKKIEINNYINNNCYNFLQFKKKILFKKNYKNDPIKKIKFIRSLLENIVKITNDFEKEIYIQEIISMFKIKKDILYKELFNMKNKKINTLKFSKKNNILLFEKELIYIILSYGDKILNNNKTTIIEKSIKFIKNENYNFSYNIYQQIFNKIKKGFKKGELRTKKFFLKKKLFIKYIKDILYKKKYKLANWKKKNIFLISLDKRIKIHFSEILLQYKLYCLSKLIKKNIKIINSFFLKKEKKNKILKKILNLIKLKNKINKKLNRFI